MAVNKRLNRLIRQSLYSLKREYGGGPFDIYSFSGASVNYQTGSKVVTKDVTRINRAIILPATLKRDLIQTISMISANKQFVYGGTHDARQRAVIIDRRDAPDLTLNEDDWCVFDGRKYEILKIQEFEFDTAWVLTIKELVGEVPEQIHVCKADHLLSLTSTAEEVE